MNELRVESYNNHLENLKLLYKFCFNKTVLVREKLYKLINIFRSFRCYKSTQSYIKSMDNYLKSSNNIFIMVSRYYRLERVINNVK